MYLLRTITLGLLLFLSYNAIYSQTFPCDGSLFFTTNSSSGFTPLNEVIFGPFGAVFFGQARTFRGGNFNALGFNPEDGYIYGVRANSNEIVRLKADGTFEVIGTAPNLDVLTTTAGDCTPSGKFLCHDQVLDQILVFDVINDFKQTTAIDLFWDPQSENSGPFTARIDDFVIDPLDTLVAYSFQGSYFDADLAPEGTRGYLLRINLDFASPNLGMVTPIARIPDDVIRKIGSLFFSPDGTLYAYGATSPNPNQTQNQLLSINKTSGAVNIKYGVAGPGAVYTDGCSCPYRLSFTNFAAPNFALCTNSGFSYMLTIDNKTFQDIPSASIADTLVEGMVISNISGNFNGNIATGTGIGTRILQLDNLNISARTNATINIEVAVIDIPIDKIPNQAFLTNLPDKFGYDVVSDDPATIGFVGDATVIFSDPQRLEAFTIDITHPTDCLQPDGGRIVIAAPVLIPGIEYEVSMRNEDWEETLKKVVIDAQNSFVLDSLLPGAYTLKSISPQNSRCSFAMKDTTITVKAPNELIQAEVFTNSPICEGTTLELSATIFPPEGTVKWRGPYVTGLKDLAITIDSAGVEQNGPYEMVFSYGVCELTRTLEVAVSPDIAATIGSQDAYCERDTIQLKAQGTGNANTFFWTNPEGITSTDSMIDISSASALHEGFYELIIDNGNCQDTINKFIQVSPAPTLALPEVMKSDFCNPIVLNPTLDEFANISYNWTPTEGLSCIDCPNPAIARPINYRYQLQVQNAFGCQDSARIFVQIDPDKIIYPPNVFSPNDDGVNDYFQIFPNCSVATIEKFQIFDRFGNLVHSVKPIENFMNQRLLWDGRFRGTEASIGVYLWLLDFTLIDGTKRRLNGDVTLFR